MKSICFGNSNLKNNISYQKWFISRTQENHFTTTRPPTIWLCWNKIIYWNIYNLPDGFCLTPLCFFSFSISSCTGNAQPKQPVILQRGQGPASKGWWRASHATEFDDEFSTRTLDMTCRRAETMITCSWSLVIKRGGLWSQEGMFSEWSMYVESNWK